ncbi:MAG: glycosyltransferase family 2 protein [Phycisphaerales bacterium]|nr:glycosyltransferase family 2 protein [Phycisphaerales bacterium]
MPIPAVTFVIPCHNHGRFVAAAVGSALAQAGADVRVVVVDDGSGEDSARRCAECAGPRVRVIRQENRGLPAARNAGAHGADSPYLAFLDADDTVEPRFATALAAALGGAPGASHAYCHERIVGLHEGQWRVPEWDPLLLMVTNLHPVTALVRRECFERVGGFDESLSRGYEDWDLWLKFAERGWRGVRVPEMLFNWNRHSPVTMVTGAASRHEALFRDLMSRHAEMYHRHAEDLLARAVGALRRAEMHWVDEDGQPINLRALRAEREMYESMAAVRLHHALHRAVRALPRPLAAAATGMLRLARAVLPGARAAANTPAPSAPRDSRGES